MLFWWVFSWIILRVVSFIKKWCYITFNLAYFLVSTNFISTSSSHLWWLINRWNLIGLVKMQLMNTIHILCVEKTSFFIFKTYEYEFVIGKTYGHNVLDNRNICFLPKIKTFVLNYSCLSLLKHLSIMNLISYFNLSLKPQNKFIPCN